MVPATLTMASTTFLTTWFHRRSLRHVWLIVGFAGTAACAWWLSSLDNLTSKEHVAFVMACWGAFLGLIAVFLTDEIEAINPNDFLKDFLYAGTLAVVGFAVPIIIVPVMIVPTATGTVVKAASIAVGFRMGLRFLSLTMLTLGLPVSLLLWRAARRNCAPPGAGYV